MPMADEQMYKVEPDVLRYKLTKAMPYFSDVIYRLRPRIVDRMQMPDGMATFGIDKHFNWYYTAEVPFTPDEQIAVLYHEINHGIRNHAGRAHDRDPRQWNIAGDREINDWFPSGMTPPKKGIGSKKYGMDDCGLPDDELAEWYFDRLDQYELHAREDATSMSPGQGKCKTHPGCDNKDVKAVIGLAPNYDIKKKGKLHVPVCGGVSGNPDPDAEGQYDGEGDGMSEVEAESVRQNVAEKILKEAQRGRGTIPGSLVDWAEELLNPVVPWQKLLKTAARRASMIIAGDTHQTYQRPARRQPPRIIMPKRIAHKTVAAFYIDTSGSMSDEEISQAIAEVKAALRTNLAEMTVSFADTDVYETLKATNGHYKKPNRLQRGGTDMAKCFDHAHGLRPKPNLILVFTDGQTPWPDDPPAARTIILLTRDYKQWGGHWPTPPWAFKVIEMEERKH